MSAIFFDVVRENELDAAHRIEVEGYPEDEAASLDAFRYRQSNAPELFLGAYLPGPSESSPRECIGYVCSTLSPDTTLTHASMSTHVPGGASVCIHSVCVAPARRRQRVGLNLLTEYTSRLAAARNDDGSARTTYKYDRVLLIVHEELRAFYERAGFEWVGPSAVVHGARPWFEMRKTLRAGPAPALAVDAPPPPTAAPDALPAGLWEALQRASAPARARPAALLLDSFPNGLADVVVAAAGETDAGEPTNKFDLLCPRPGCGSVVLRKSVGRWVERASVQLDPAPAPAPSSAGPAGASATAVPRPAYLGALPPPPETAHWWLVGPSAMAFENVGFSRAVQGLTGPSGRKMKLIICAECDVGPLGWCEEGGNEFWLACNRVGYRT